MANMTNTNERVSTAVRICMAVNREGQSDVARVIGVTRSAITARMKGRTSWSLDDLDALARHWRTTVAALVDPVLPAPLQANSTSQFDTHWYPTVVPLFRRPVVGTVAA